MGKFDVDNLSKYLAQMELVKKRMAVIDNILKKKATTGYVYSDIEICVLQLRKIIELIAMGSLVSNVDKYSQIHERYADNWNARMIFRDIQRINSEFYPIPVKTDDSKGIGEFIHIESGFLTLEDAIYVYEKCGGFLHEDNPFKSPHDVAFYEEHIPIWKSKIRRLLNAHIIHLCEDELYYVIMRSSDTGNAAGNIFEKVESISNDINI